MYHCHLFKDGSSFVSHRDVERVMQVMMWFYNRVDILGKLMTEVLTEQRRQEGYYVIEDDDNFGEQVSLFWATISNDVKIVKTFL